MSLKKIFLAAIVVVFFLAIASPGVLFAQETESQIVHTDVFGKLRRPPAVFSHDLHMDALSDQGCGVCHHVYDKKAGKLIYEEGEEAGCTDCHGKNASGNTPALREAYHGSCNACHRSRIEKNLNAGPDTCGECHPKRGIK